MSNSGGAAGEASKAEAESSRERARPGGGPSSDGFDDFFVSHAPADDPCRSPPYRRPLDRRGRRRRSSRTCPRPLGTGRAFAVARRLGAEGRLARGAPPPAAPPPTTAKRLRPRRIGRRRASGRPRRRSRPSATAPTGDDRPALFVRPSRSQTSRSLSVSPQAPSRPISTEHSRHFAPTSARISRRDYVHELHA